MSCLVRMEVLCQVPMHALKAFADGLRDSPISAGDALPIGWNHVFWGMFDFPSQWNP